MIVGGFPVNSMEKVNVISSSPSGVNTIINSLGFYGTSDNLKRNALRIVNFDISLFFVTGDKSSGSYCDGAQNEKIIFHSCVSFKKH